jgi:hypothetical protein
VIKLKNLISSFPSLSVCKARPACAYPEIVKRRRWRNGRDERKIGTSFGKDAVDQRALQRLAKSLLTV